MWSLGYLHGMGSFVHSVVVTVIRLYVALSVVNPLAFPTNCLFETVCVNDDTLGRQRQ